MRGLEGRVALVIGAARGIGRAIAIRLSEEGARVAAADLDEAGARDTARVAGAGAVAIYVDVTGSDSVRAEVAAAERALGPIDVLVNKAGRDKVEPFVRSAEETWEKVIAINLQGVLRCTRAVVERMIARRHGRIVSIASDAARVGSTGEALCSAAKSGVITVSKTLARQVVRHGINVNAVCPGPTDTPLFHSIAEENPKLMDALGRAVPLGPIGKLEEIAAAVAFLASDDASFVTGQTLSVSGSLTMA